MMDKVQKTTFTDKNAPLSETFRLHLQWDPSGMYQVDIMLHVSDTTGMCFLISMTSYVHTTYCLKTDALLNAFILFIHGLFNDNFSCLDYIASNEGMNNKLGRILKEVVMAELEY
jgi:hypothetical protein